MSALPVTLVRPRLSGRKALVKAIASVGGIFLRGWLLMLIAPAVWEPISYWHSVAIVWAVGLLLYKQDVMYELATAEAKR